MPYRPPLVPHETFVADPPDLPVRRPGEQGPSTVTRVGLVAIEPQGISLKGQTSDGSAVSVRVVAAGEGIIRVHLADDPQTRTRSARAISLVHPDEAASAQISLSAESASITTGDLVAEVTFDPWHLRFRTVDGRELLTQDRGQDDISGRTRTLPFGRSAVDETVVAYHDSFIAQADEHFVGFGEKFTSLDKRGQRATMWNFDAFGAESDRSHKCVPAYLSSRGYGLVVDSGLPVEFDVCQSTHGCLQILAPDDALDYYVIAAPTPTVFLNRLDQLTCRPVLPPKWAFGTWISSGFLADTQEQVLGRARTIREHGIPCDVLHLDCYWQVVNHWSDLQWDPVNFPDPDGMLRELADQGFRVCLWINPYLSHLSPAFGPAAEAGYFLRRQDGEVYMADVWHGAHPASGIIDFTNPEATAWFTDLLRPLLRQGVAVFKTDFAEGVPFDAVAANGMTGTELHNVYTLLFNDAVSSVTHEITGYSPVWARSSYLGGQRHGAQWSGDVKSSYSAMGGTIRGGLSHGLSGIPFWSHDTGGFHGTPTPDLFVRWAQFGALSPLLRLHGTSSRLPWDFPVETEQAVVAALQLRYQLMPYLFTAADEAARTGVPMMRALLIDSPEDPAAWNADLEYRLGRDLLVAPMINPDGRRQVYLPAGEDWVDWWTGTVHCGGQYLTVAPPLEQAPLFVRYGALIPTVEVSDTVTDEPFTDITLVSWGGVDARTTIHDVTGDTVVTAIREGGALQVTVTGTVPVARIALASLSRDTAPNRVFLNGEPTTADNWAPQ